MNTQFIGIVGNDKQNTISDLIHYVLNGSGYTTLLVSSNLLMLNQNIIEKSCISLEDIEKFSKDNDKRVDFFIINNLKMTVLKKLLKKNKINALLDLKSPDKNGKIAEEKLMRSIIYRNLKHDGIAIINSDNKDNLCEFTYLRDRIVITYGLDLRATITTSSVPMRDEVTLICCLQRGITTLEGEDIEPMEFPIKFYYHDQFTVNNVLPVIALALRYGTSVENLQEILSKYKGRI